MRRKAFVSLVLALLLLSVMLVVLDHRRPPVQPLPCTQVVMITERGEDRLVCATDPSVATCPSIRPGFRYRGCEELGTVPGAILLMRGLPLSAAHATSDDLVALQGVGPSLAARMVAARRQGPFCNLEDLQRVSGIGAKRAVSIGAHLTFDDPLCAVPRAPVDSIRR